MYIIHNVTFLLQNVDISLIGSYFCNIFYDNTYDSTLRIISLVYFILTYEITFLLY